MQAMIDNAIACSLKDYTTNAACPYVIHRDAH
jgi:hypothetical protein